MTRIANSSDPESQRGAWARRLGNASVLIGAVAAASVSTYEIAIASGRVEDPGVSAIDVVLPCIIGGWVACGLALLALILRARAPENIQRRAIVGLVLGALPMVLPSLLW